ncbi:unnamed protein product [Toxocara canis]|uniref:Chromosome partition protein Smc n=1 Tax=Toxocara canis TaxID=6265 RepID=A0A183UBE7_TOXCA|nr:unnamed protein product [Toxocara canis]
MAILNNSLEEAKTKMNSADKKEREVRNALNNINTQVGKVFGIEKAGGNLKTNVKILKGISARINQQLSSLEKEKTIQDAYVTRIKRDVEASEKELLNLQNAFAELKKEQIQRKSNYEELAEKLKAFEDGSFSVEDRWQTLMKEEKTKQFSLMAGNHTNEGELTRKANELSKIDAALAARLKIRRMKEQELEQFEKALNETKSDIVKRKEEIALLEEGVIRAELQLSKFISLEHRIS